MRAAKGQSDFWRNVRQVPTAAFRTKSTRIPRIPH
jgi:hypothetical protein